VGLFRGISIGIRNVRWVPTPTVGRRLGLLRGGIRSSGGGIQSDWRHPPAVGPYAFDYRTKVGGIRVGLVLGMGGAARAVFKAIRIEWRPVLGMCGAASGYSNWVSIWLDWHWCLLSAVGLASNVVSINIRCGRWVCVRLDWYVSAAYGEFVFNKGGELVTVAGAD